MLRTPKVKALVSSIMGLFVTKKPNITCLNHKDVYFRHYYLPENLCNVKVENCELYDNTGYGVRVFAATVKNVFVEAGFDAGNDQWWNSEQSELTQIKAGWKYTVKLYLRVPLSKHTRLLVHVVMDGYTVDESYSKWFDT
jgi:hypothetical protein